MKLQSLVRNPWRRILLFWAIWAVVLIGFQGIVRIRFQAAYPDTVLDWTPYDTRPSVWTERSYLSPPVFNAQVAYDSEFYLSIATAGYNDPSVRVSEPRGPEDAGHPAVTLNYAFFPLYPFVMKIARLPFVLFGMSPLGASAVAGVLVSVFGALLAMLALFDLARRELDENEAFRSVFFLLIFPTGFFLAQVYAEGLFLGLTFASLAALGRKKWLLAAIFAAFAVWTRAVGVCLFVALGVAWIRDIDWKSFRLKPFPWKQFGRALLVLVPIGSYLLWRLIFGEKFDFVERTFFGRGFLQIGQAAMGWYLSFLQMRTGENLARSYYYALEFVATILAIVSCVMTMKKRPELSLFGLAVIAISTTSGNAMGFQGMARYMLAVPSMFVVLGRWSRNPLFDRAWTLGSGLLMGLSALLFSFNYWVA